MKADDTRSYQLWSESVYWVFIFLFIAVWLPFRMYLPATMHFRHTYELPAANCVNRLTSDLWSWEWLRETLIVFNLLLPVTGMFMIWSKRKAGWGMHIFVLVCLIVWALVMVGYDIRDVGAANVDPSNERWNPANLATDRQWCLVYGGQPGTDLVCANSGICTAATSAVGPENLGLNPPFAMRVAFNVILLAFCLADMAFTLGMWRIVLNNLDATTSPPPATPSPPATEPVQYQLLRARLAK